MDWKTFIISILGSGAITALVNGWMNHRTQIKAIKESGLYAKRAEVLDEMMKRMERLDRIIGELVSFVQYKFTEDDENKRREDASKAFNYFTEHYKRNRHYLPKSLSDEISQLCTDYKQLFIDFSYSARIQGEKPDTDKWQSLIKKYQEEFPIKREKVAEEFRKIIGVK